MGVIISTHCKLLKVETLAMERSQTRRRRKIPLHEVISAAESTRSIFQNELIKEINELENKVSSQNHVLSRQEQALVNKKLRVRMAIEGVDALYSDALSRVSRKKPSRPKPSLDLEDVWLAACSAKQAAEDTSKATARLAEAVANFRGAVSYYAAVYGGSGRGLYDGKAPSRGSYVKL